MKINCFEFRAFICYDLLWFPFGRVRERVYYGVQSCPSDKQLAVVEHPIVCLVNNYKKAHYIPNETKNRNIHFTFSFGFSFDFHSCVFYGKKMKVITLVAHLLRIWRHLLSSDICIKAIICFFCPYSTESSLNFKYYSN